MTPSNVRITRRVGDRNVKVITQSLNEDGEWDNLCTHMLLQEGKEVENSVWPKRRILIVVD